MLAVVTICYRDVVRSYPKAGGSYVVSRDNFGPNVAQVAGAALLISYTITVAVSVAAGADAIISAVPALAHDAVPMSIGFVLLLAYGNLRGIREAGRVFAIPTYFFIANMAILIVAGLVKAATTGLPDTPEGNGTMPLGHAGGGLILGISAFYLLRAFAKGSSAMTGTEAISNGVSIFRSPQARNARTTLVLMSTILGVMFLGVSVLAAITHALPFVSGTPTVVSEIGKLVYGSSPMGQVLFYLLQGATALILILAANTSFTGFPFLVSFVAEDSFLPRMLTVRGHRLVFSNGIILLATASIVLLLVTGARVSALIPMYAIGVFTGFTMAGAGMVRHHLTHRDEHWRKSVAVNATAAVVCARHRGGVRRRRVHPGRVGRGGGHAPDRVRLGAHQPGVPLRGRRAGGGGGHPGLRGPHPPAQCGGHPDRPDRPGHGPGHPVRPQAHPRTTCGPSTSTSTTPGPRCSSTGGSAWACPGCLSTSSTALTAASPGPRWSWPLSWPMARPKSASSCPAGPTARPGAGSSTTRPPTRSSRW